MKKIKVKYFARCEGIKRMGPYDNELQAWEALRSIKDGNPVEGSIVWPERVDSKAFFFERIDSDYRKC